MLHTDRDCDQRDQREDSQAQADVHQDADREDRVEECIDRVHDAGAQDGTHRGKIVCGPGHEVSGGVRLEKPSREGLKVGKQEVPEIARVWSDPGSIQVGGGRFQRGC